MAPTAPIPTTFERAITPRMPTSRQRPGRGRPDPRRAAEAPHEPARPGQALDADLLRAALDQATEAIVIADSMGRILFANEAIQRLVARPRAELIGRHFVMALADDDEPSAYDGISLAVSRGDTWSGLRTVKLPDGSSGEVQLVVSPVHDGSGKLSNVIAVSRDVSHERSLEGDLAQAITVHDGILTTLAHLDRAETVDTRAARLVEGLVSIEGVTFARVISFGPGDLAWGVAAHGDDARGMMAPGPMQAPVAALRRRARFGPWIEPVGGSTSPGRLARDLEANGITALGYVPLVHHGSPVGLLVGGTSAVDGPAILERNLRWIQELGTVGSAVLGASFAARASTTDVRSAIEGILRDRSFRSVFQPIVQLRDDAVIGFEALTRFDDGVTPDVHFAEAAAVGLGLELEVATLHAALTSATALPSHAFLSVNVSPALVLDRKRLELVLRDAERAIVLEITEREPVDDYAELRSAISTIVAPLRWAIDDAGAGYASLRHILELRPQFVKLDRQLIAGIALDPARQALVAGLLHFSEAVGTTLIGEGIETAAERVALQGLGLVAGQGWLFGRPVAADVGVRDAGPDRLGGES